MSTNVGPVGLSQGSVPAQEISEEKQITGGEGNPAAQSSCQDLNIITDENTLVEIDTDGDGISDKVGYDSDGDGTFDDTYAPKFVNGELTEANSREHADYEYSQGKVTKAYVEGTPEAVKNIDPSAANYEISYEYKDGTDEEISSVTYFNQDTNEDVKFQKNADGDFYFETEHKKQQGTVSKDSIGQEAEAGKMVYDKFYPDSQQQTAQETLEQPVQPEQQEQPAQTEQQEQPIWQFVSYSEGEMPAPPSGSTDENVTVAAASDTTVSETDDSTATEQTEQTDESGDETVQTNITSDNADTSLDSETSDETNEENSTADTASQTTSTTEATQTGEITLEEYTEAQLVKYSAASKKYGS